MKVLHISKCEDCKNYIFDDNDIIERWGKHWCVIEDKECPESAIPDWCQLEDVIGE